jgi:hypothetical protein
MTALEPGRDSRPPGDRLDHAVVIALAMAAGALAVAGLTSQRLGVPVALWVAAGGAVPLSLGMLLIAAERGRRVRETERVKRRETAAVLAEKLAEARRRAEAAEPWDAPPVVESPPEAVDVVGSVPYPTDEPLLSLVPESDPDDDGPAPVDAGKPVIPECSSIDRVAQLEETIVDLNRQVDELTRVIQGASRGARAARSGRHSGPPETVAPAESAAPAQTAQNAQTAPRTETPKPVPAPRGITTPREMTEEPA